MDLHLHLHLLKSLLRPFQRGSIIFALRREGE
jgi:hypothetical protein